MRCHAVVCYAELLTDNTSSSSPPNSMSRIHASRVAPTCLTVTASLPDSTGRAASTFCACPSSCRLSRYTTTCRLPCWRFPIALLFFRSRNTAVSMTDICTVNQPERTSRKEKNIRHRWITMSHFYSFQLRLSILTPSQSRNSPLCNSCSPLNHPLDLLMSAR